MEDPVAHVNGSTHDREYIERWFRERQQKRQPVKHRRQEEEELEPEAAAIKPEGQSAAAAKDESFDQCIQSTCSSMQQRCLDHGATYHHPGRKSCAFKPSQWKGLKDTE